MIVEQYNSSEINTVNIFSFPWPIWESFHTDMAFGNGFICYSNSFRNCTATVSRLMKSKEPAGAHHRLVSKDLFSSLSHSEEQYAFIWEL